MIEQEKRQFMSSFPTGALISFIEGVQHIHSNARSIFRIDKYELSPKGSYFMYGIWCGFDFQTTQYEKEFSWSDLSKWHCIDRTGASMGIALGTILHKFNDVRFANELERSIFYKCLIKPL